MIARLPSISEHGSARAIIPYEKLYLKIKGRDSL
jgi:hypothetical protein